MRVPYNAAAEVPFHPSWAGEHQPSAWTQTFPAPPAPLIPEPAPLTGSSEGGDTIVNNAAINGTITADDDAGRIVGYVFYPGSSTISDNFAVEGMAAGGVAGFDAADTRRRGVDKSDADLKRQTTYSNELGWKFGGTDSAPWRMPTGGGYPTLYWE